MRTRFKRKSAVLSRCIETLESRQLLAATHLVFLTQPTTAVAGATVAPEITVAVEDGSNNVVTSDSSSVTIAIKSSTGATGAALSGTKTVAAVKGIATFSDLSLDLSSIGGTAYKLTASDASLTAANSNSFNISPTTASKVEFKTQPADAAAGAAIDDFEVDVKDKFGNIVTSDFSNVTLSIATGVAGATL